MIDSAGKGLFTTKLIDPNISHIMPLGITENNTVSIDMLDFHE
jgi:hypothetical protein